ncbi:MAG: sensor histidine kinase [Acidobacteria bacterium]|nr:sensor histidine kinase [Acidobacteriota bacterium]
MRLHSLKTWPVAAAALTGLLVVITASLLTTARRAEVIYGEIDALNRHHREIETTLRRLRSDVHLSGIFIRDYLLDPSRDKAPEYRAQLTDLRQQQAEAVAELGTLPQADGLVDVASLKVKLDDYWQAFEPVFDWNIIQKVLNSTSFLRNEVLPRREAVLAIARDIEALNDANLVSQRAAVARKQEAFRADLRRVLWQSVIVGALVAITAVLALRTAERRSDEERDRAEQAEEHMRHLSHGLVSMQEEERRKLSRELHDHVGQMLTALRMAIGRAERVDSPVARTAVLADARTQVDELIESVRDLSLGLRPSMLDDFGLSPALEWLARDFQRRADLDVRLTMSGPMTALSDAQRTCIYRVVQEALTNCARHAAATHVDVLVAVEGPSVLVSVKDDGRGVERTRATNGLGLVGIAERARELGGTFDIGPGAADTGTHLRVRLPMRPAQAEEALDAAVAG